MPEAVLARELEIEYASIAVVVNWAAGIEGQPITMDDILRNMEQGIDRLKPLLRATLDQM